MILIRKLAIDEQPPWNLLLLADPSMKMVQEYIVRGECYVAETDKVVGVYVMAATNEETVEIMNIAVAKEQQGQGIGKQLILDAIEKAKQAGFKRIEIGTGNSSIHQLALYQKCGFRITGLDQDYFIRNYSEKIFENGIQCVDRIRLSKKLGE